MNSVAIAISPTITNRGYDFVFRTSPNSPQFLEGINKWLADVKRPKTVAFFMENSDYGRDGQKIWEAQCEKLGAKVLDRLYFEIGSTDFTAPISKLKDLKPEVVFNIASTTEAALIQKQARELNYYTQWIGVGGHAVVEQFRAQTVAADVVAAHFLVEVLFLDRAFAETELDVIGGSKATVWSFDSGT